MDEEAEAPEPGRKRRRRSAKLWWAAGTAVAVLAAVVVPAVLVGGGGGTRQQAQVPTPSSTRMAPSESATAKRAARQTQTPGTVRLPRGGTATLVRKAVDPDGTLPIPADLDDAAWWGAMLGESGAALLSGHVDYAGETGPFHELWSDHDGQRIVVRDTSGGVWTYRISKVLTLGKDELPARAPELFAQHGRHRLVLVTCGGTFVGGGKGYSRNRIVIATLVSRPA